MTGGAFDDGSVHDVACHATIVAAHCALEEDEGVLVFDSLIDRIVPDSIDWRETVRRFPAASLISLGVVAWPAGRRRRSASR